MGIVGTVNLGLFQTSNDFPTFPNNCSIVAEFSTIRMKYFIDFYINKRTKEFSSKPRVIFLLFFIFVCNRKRQTFASLVVTMSCCLVNNHHCRWPKRIVQCWIQPPNTDEILRMLAIRSDVKRQFSRSLRSCRLCSHSGQGNRTNLSNWKRINLDIVAQPTTFDDGGFIYLRLSVNCNRFHLSMALQVVA